MILSDRDLRQRLRDRSIVVEPLADLELQLQPASIDLRLGNAGAPADAGHRNVLGAPLQRCPSAHETGFYRDGFCNTGADDAGVHVVCARVTDNFLQFSRAQGNDLITQRGGFPGLKAGDGWCLCASRWREAVDAGVAQPVVLEATHEAALRVASLKQLSSAPQRIPSPRRSSLRP
jgi:hypothetical protein